MTQAIITCADCGAVKPTQDSTCSSCGSVKPHISVQLVGQQINITLGVLSAQTLINCIETSKISLIKQTMLIAIINELTRQGFVEIKDLIEKAYNVLENADFSILMDIINLIRD